MSHISARPLATFRSGKSDAKNENLFCGQSVSIARYDSVKYPPLVKLLELHQSFFWLPHEVSLVLDRIQFKEKLLPHERQILIENLSYQVVMDSEQGRAPALVLLAVCSLPELEGWISYWTAGEGIHNQTYSYINRSVLDDPADVFDKITVDPQIVKRTEAVSFEYDKLYDMICKRHVCGVDEHELKVQIYRTIVCINALEAIRFFVSFACTFAFAEDGVLEGVAKLMKLIARDEDLHCQGTEMMLNWMSSGSEGDEWRTIAQEQKEFTIETMTNVALQEMEWADHVFRDGAMFGLNSEILKKYVQHRTNLACSRIKVLDRVPFPDVLSDPLPWMDKWTKNDSVQTAPQETEMTSYQVGQIDPHVNDETLRNILDD